jgi:large subunit ribosomal protein L4
MSEAQIDIAIHDGGGKEIGKTSVDLAKLDKRLRPALIKTALSMYQANKRVGTHDTKTRGEIRGSTHKPWRQKGTGRARSGTKKSPIWKGGGVVFGPHPRNYRFAINKKQRRLALRSALMAKFRDGEVKVVDQIELDAPKTSVVAAVLKALGVSGTCLIGTSEVDRNLYLSTRNIRGASVATVADFNTLDVLRAKTVVLTQSALAGLVSAGEGDS